MGVRNSRPQRRGAGSIWLVLHRWVGLVAALPLLLLAITGCLLAFKPELQDLEMPEIYHVEPEGNPASAETVLARIQEEWPKTHLAHTQFPQAGDEPYLAFANRPVPDGEGREGFRLLVNPYTLVIHRQDGRGGWIGWVESLHRNLILGPTGRWITAVSSVVVVALLISGVVLWWPIRQGTLRRFWRNGQVLAWHNVLGLFSAPVVLVLAITGASFHFGWAVFPVVEAATGGAPSKEKPVSESSPDRPTLTPAKAVQKARGHLGDNDRIAALGMPGDTDGVIKVHVAEVGALNQYGWRRLYLDRASGKLLGQEDFWEQGLGPAYRRSFWAWHAGIFFGLPGRLVWAGGSAALVGLVATGAWWWWRKRR